MRTDDKPEHDAAGNFTRDALHKYTYDAWNRLAKVERAWRDGNVVTGSTVATMECNGLGRRIVKTVGDANAAIVVSE